jgi:serine/threonine protein kinase
MPESAPKGAGTGVATPTRREAQEVLRRVLRRVCHGLSTAIGPRAAAERARAADPHDAAFAGGVVYLHQGPTGATASRTAPKMSFEEAGVTAGASAPAELARASTDPRLTDLSYFRARALSHTEAMAMPHGEFTMVRKLCTGVVGRGSVFEYMWRRSWEGDREGEAVVTDRRVAVKKLKREDVERTSRCEVDERKIHLQLWKQNVHVSEDAVTEIGVLSYLSKQPDIPMYFLRILGVFTEQTSGCSAGSSVCLVTELAEGGELFELAGKLSEEGALKYTRHLLQATAYLHEHGIGHRDISLENLLLKDGVARVMDFGMAVRSRSASDTPLRFFLAVGKDNYRAPECYVPNQEIARVPAPAGALPGDVCLAQVGSQDLCEVRMPPDVVPGQICKAQIWGYAVEPADVFACGVCLFILSYGCPLWPKARRSDAYFNYVYKSGRGPASLLQHWGKPLLSPEVMTLLTGMLAADPRQRPPAAECLDYPCIAAVVAEGHHGGNSSPRRKGGG